MPNFQEIIAKKKEKLKQTPSLTNRNLIRNKSKEEKIETIYNSMLKNIEIPKRFENKTFENFDDSRLKFNKDNPAEKVREYTNTFKERLAKGDWLILSGSYGLGKTHLAIAAAKEILYYFAEKYYENNEHSTNYSGASKKITFIPSSELIQEIRDSYDSDMRDERSIMNKYKTVPLLILDDLGTEKASDWQKEKIYNILNHRYLQMFPTIITTNLGSKGLKDQVSERVVERMIEAAGNGRYLWKFKGESYRRSK